MTLLWKRPAVPHKTPTPTHRTQSRCSSASFIQLQFVVLASCNGGEYFMSRRIVWHNDAISELKLLCAEAGGFKTCQNSHSSSLRHSCSQTELKESETKRREACKYGHITDHTHTHTHTHTYSDFTQKADSEGSVEMTFICSAVNMSHNSVSTDGDMRPSNHQLIWIYDAHTNTHTHKCIFSNTAVQL